MLLQWEMYTGPDGLPCKRLQLDDLTSATPARVYLYLYGNLATYCQNCCCAKDKIRLTGAVLEPYREHDFDECRFDIVIRPDCPARLQVQDGDSQQWGRVVHENDCGDDGTQAGNEAVDARKKRKRAEAEKEKKKKTKYTYTLIKDLGELGTRTLGAQNGPRNTKDHVRNLYGVVIDFSHPMATRGTGMHLRHRYSAVNSVGNRLCADSPCDR